MKAGISDLDYIGFRKLFIYENKHAEIDFFRSMGRLAKWELNLLWYKDSSGAMSECGEHLNDPEEKWHDYYWGNFDSSITTKLKEWEYEEEQRIIIDGAVTDYADPKSRKLKYDFNDLEEIIFGIKIAEDDKLKILQII